MKISKSQCSSIRMGWNEKYMKESTNVSTMLNNEINIVRAIAQSPCFWCSGTISMAWVFLRVIAALTPSAWIPLVTSAFHCCHTETVGLIRGQMIWSSEAWWGMTSGRKQTGFSIGVGIWSCCCIWSANIEPLWDWHALKGKFEFAGSLPAYILVR